MAHETAPMAAVNARAYRDFMARHPANQHVPLTTDQLEAICRDLEGYATLYEEHARLHEALERVREAVRMECLISEDLLDVDAWVGYAAMRAAAARIGATLTPPDPPDAGGA